MEFNARRIVLFGLMFVLVAGVITVSVFAMPFGGFGVLGRGSLGNSTSANDTFRSDMIAALDNADYSSYMNASDKQWETFRASITQDKFNAMVSRYNGMKNMSVNISENMNKGKNMMYGRYGAIGRNNNNIWNNTGWNNTNIYTNMSVLHDAEVKLQQAIASGDYASWKDAVDALNSNAPSGMPYFSNNMTDKITADNFATYVNFTKAIHDGDFNTAKQLASNLGIEGYAIPMMPLGQRVGPIGMHSGRVGGRFGRG